MNDDRPTPAMDQVTTVSTESQSRGLRAIALYREAKSLADENVRHFRDALKTALTLADEIAQGDDLYPADLHEICRKLVESPAFGLLSSAAPGMRADTDQVDGPVSTPPAT